jgi:carboxymethylenebutenolidase
LVHHARWRAPAGIPRGALIVVQEVFGINSHIERVTDGFTADGYVTLVPAIFDRAEIYCDPPCMSELP